MLLLLLFPSSSSFGLALVTQYWNINKLAESAFQPTNWQEKWKISDCKQILHQQRCESNYQIALVSFDFEFSLLSIVTDQRHLEGEGDEESRGADQQQLPRLKHSQLWKQIHLDEKWSLEPGSGGRVGGSLKCQLLVEREDLCPLPPRCSNAAAPTQSIICSPVNTETTLLAAAPSIANVSKGSRSLSNNVQVQRCRSNCAPQSWFHLKLHSTRVIIINSPSRSCYLPFQFCRIMSAPWCKKQAKAACHCKFFCSRSASH